MCLLINKCGLTGIIIPQNNSPKSSSKEIIIRITTKIKNNKILILVKCFIFVYVYELGIIFISSQDE